VGNDQLILTDEKRWKKRLLLCGASALLFFFSFPPFGAWPIGFVALVPFHVAVRGARPRNAAFLGFAFGILSHAALLRWLVGIPVVTWGHIFLLCAILSVYPAVLALFWSRVADERAAPLWIGAAGALIDWLRGHAGMVACPWLTIAETQHTNLALLQWASIGGEAIVGFFVVVANVAIAQWIMRNRSLRASATITLVIVFLAHVAGGRGLAPVSGRDVRVSVVQGDTTSLSNADDAFARFDELTLRAATDHPDFVMWPESAAGDIESDTLALFRVRATVDRANVPLLFGSSTASRAEPGHNSLFWMEPGVPMGPPYRKIHLFPYAEYTPRGFARGLGPHMFQTIPGDIRRTFDLSGIAIAPLICFESMFADDVRSSALEGRSIIAIGVNDAWFGKTGAAELHNMVSVFRAVENRRPVVVASNGGPSQIVDSFGRILVRARSYAPDVISATVPVDDTQSIYRRWGDKAAAVIIGCALLAERLLASLVRLRKPHQH